jgi:diguanylate cyclase (GGDEF)-like protein/PAS domain S-box-containing protein
MAIYRFLDSKWFLAVFGVLLLLGTGYYSKHLLERADRDLRIELLQQARRISQAIDHHEFRVLSGNASDVYLPEYQRLKTNLMLTREVFPESRFLYLMGQNEDGSVFFFIDSEPAGSEDESPPGQIYEEVTEDLLNVLSQGVPVVEGPMTDAWGTWVSALVPLIEPNSGQVIAVFGADIAADRWTQLIHYKVSLPLLLAFFSIIFLFSSSIFLLQRNRIVHPAQQNWLYRHAEFLIALLLGILITAQVIWIVHINEKEIRAETFDRIAFARMATLTTYLRDLEYYYMMGLANFFEASEYVDHQEFMLFTSAQATDPKLQAWGWIPLVPAEELPGFEGKARLDIAPDYMVWEMDEGGQRMAVKPRPEYFPLLYVAPFEGNERPLGFDLGSEATRRAALESALASNQASASNALTLVQETGEQVGILVIKPVHGTGEYPSQAGFVLAAIRMDNLLGGASSTWVGEEQLIQIDFHQLQLYGNPLRLAGDSGNDHLRARVEKDFSIQPFDELTFIQPLFAFGKTYALVAHPSPEFSQFFPHRAGWMAALIGSIITLLTASVIHILSTRHIHLENLVIERTIELQESERRYQGLFESCPISLWEEDFSRVKQAIEQLKKEGIQDFQEYIETHPDFVTECTQMIEVLDVNQATLELFGAESKDQLMGNISRVLTDSSYEILKKELIAVAEGRTQFESEGQNNTLNGETIDILLRWSVAPGYEETLSKVIFSIVDISARKRVEKELLKQTSRAEALAEISRELSVAGFDTQAIFDTTVKRIADFIGDACVLTLLCDDNRWRQVVSFHHRDQKGLEQMRNSFSNLPTLSVEGLIGRVMRSGEQLFISDVSNGGLDGIADADYENLLVHNQVSSLLIIPLFLANQTLGTVEVWRHSHSPPLSIDERTLIKNLANQLALTITNARLHELIQYQARTDALTRINNRHHFMNMAELEFMRAKRHGRDLTLILLDLDHFKVVNDNFGHTVGDKVLQTVAQLFSSCLRSTDIIGRYGGEEFTILLPETGLRGARLLTQRIRASIASRPVQVGDNSIDITVSIGVAVMDTDTVDLVALLQKADEAMYKAKNGGRNRIAYA